MAPTIEATCPAPRRRQIKKVNPRASTIYTNLTAAGANQLGNTTYSSSKGLRVAADPSDPSAVPPTM